MKITYLYFRRSIWAAIVLFWLPLPVFGAELWPAGQPVLTAPHSRVALDVPTTFRILAVLEDYPKLKSENDALRGVIAKVEVENEKRQALEEIRLERENLYKERIVFLELQAEKWKALNEASLQLARDTRESQGSWWDKFRRDVGTLSLGAVFAIGVAAAIAF